MPAPLELFESITSPPLPLMIEKLGMAVVQAQQALDQNSIAFAQELASSEITIAGTDYNLLALGFTPTFYAFTEATIEAKMEFSMAFSTAFSIGAQVDVQKGNPVSGMVAVSVTAAYARKFSYSATGSSSFSARMVALPAPDGLADVLKQLSVAATVTE
jgi:hypothetical protein